MNFVAIRGTAIANGPSSPIPSNAASAWALISANDSGASARTISSTINLFPEMPESAQSIVRQDRRMVDPAGGHALPRRMFQQIVRVATQTAFSAGTVR
ncbi:MAG: hypothetical protein WD845_11135 [Pirellulales bacterium]